MKNMLRSAKKAPHSKLTFTCSKSTIETLEKGKNMFKVNNKNTGTTSVLVFLLLTLNLFYTLFY